MLPISEKTGAWAAEVVEKLKAAGVRASLDDSNDRIQAKAPDGAPPEWKVPYLLVVGPRDAEQGAVSVRARGIQKDLGAMPLAEFVAAVGEEIASKGKVTVVERFAVEVG